MDGVSHASVPPALGTFCPNLRDPVFLCWRRCPRCPAFTPPAPLGNPLTSPGLAARTRPHTRVCPAAQAAVATPRGMLVPSDPLFSGAPVLFTPKPPARPLLDTWGVEALAVGGPSLARSSGVEFSWCGLQDTE